jgi:probable HAF family extracellular repeat protein
MSVSRIVSACCILAAAVAACSSSDRATAPPSSTLASPSVTPTYTTIDFPGAARTAAFGINRAGTIVGDFSFTSGGQIHGWMLNAGTFTPIEFPHAIFTRPEGINDGGSIVGVYEEDNGSKLKKTHGFLFSGGVFSSIDFPGANETTALGIDKLGRVVGGYCTGADSCYDAGTNVHGYLLAGGVFTAIDFPGAVFSEVSGITDGEILGRYATADGNFHLFVLSNGSFTSIDFPGALETAPFLPRFKAGAINAAGEIASYYCTATVCTPTSMTVHGFILSGGTFTSFDFPGAFTTAGLDINSIDDIVGTYVAPTGEHGYLRTP